MYTHMLHLRRGRMSTQRAAGRAVRPYTRNESETYLLSVHLAQSDSRPRDQARVIMVKKRYITFWAA